MANFGFSHLTVVAPYAPHWREARSAIGAPDLLHQASEAATLRESVAHCTLVAGTGTREHRRPDQRLVSLPELTPIFLEETLRGGRAALVFGPEKHGLTRDDLACCHLFAEIPTHPRQPSMNLGQAVAVCLYELAVRSKVAAIAASNETTSSVEASGQAAHPISDRLGGPDAGTGTTAGSGAASSGVLDLLAWLIEESMLEAGYSPAAMRKANRRSLDALLRRLTFSDPDARRSLRFFRRVLWRLRRQDSCTRSD